MPKVATVKSTPASGPLGTHPNVLKRNQVGEHLLGVDSNIVLTVVFYHRHNTGMSSMSAKKTGALQPYLRTFREIVITDTISAHAEMVILQKALRPRARTRC